MKQLLINSFSSLVTGIFFAIGLILVGVVATEFYDDKDSMPELEYTRLPGGFSVVEHSVVKGRPSFTIRGRVKNSSAETWQQVRLSADIKAGDALVNQCETEIHGDFPPSSERSFEIECYHVSGSNLPDNISYQLSVVSAGSGG
jgi:uncharacterized protein (TIGR02588 family)